MVREGGIGKGGGGGGVERPRLSSRIGINQLEFTR